MTEIKAPKKLIEVALPLDDINVASIREKSIRHGHPSTLHLWWARRPLSAARAVLFAQMVNDPGYETGRGFTRGVNKKQAAIERERLFEIMRELVKWENTSNDAVLEAARDEIRKSWHETCDINKKHPQASELFNPDKLPAFHDPFAGGGAIPLEAQRLGLESNASDLNPVAVLINKAMIEIPPKFAGRSPIGPIPNGEKQAKLHDDWSGARGLAEDVRRYGHWMRAEAEKRIGQLYPKVLITESMAEGRPDLRSLVGQELTIIAWLWARTVRSPNPAYSNVEVPLVSTFVLSKMKGSEAWIEPVVEGHEYRFAVRTKAAEGRSFPSKAVGGTSAGKRAGFVCLVSNAPIDYKYIRSEGTAGRLGERLMAIVADGPRGRVYLSPTDAMQSIPASAAPTWRPDVKLHGKCRVNVSNYGLDTFGDLFTDRQLVALTTFSDLVSEVSARVRRDALKAGYSEDPRPLSEGGTGALAYSQAMAVYLTMVLNRVADYNSTLCTWHVGGPTTGTKSRNTFSRQALPMSWDFLEVNPLSDQSGSLANSIGYAAKSIANLGVNIVPGKAEQSDATNTSLPTQKVVSTDPPYYDNIGYADLSDFLYVWLRRGLRGVYPDLFSTVATPKLEELIATPYRHKNKQDAEKFFLEGMTAAMKNLAQRSFGAFPVTIYYAFKQSETKEAGTFSTGWETFLAAVTRAGFVLTGTWPMRTELGNRMIGSGANALASSIVLVCRRRRDDAPSVSRKEFLRELKEAMKDALDAMLGGEGNVSPIAPVDLAQAAIGPGMAVFSQYAAVIEANGDAMGVHTALTLINKQVDEALGGENFDPDTNFCLGWFQDEGWSAGEYGKANTLAQAKATSVLGAQGAGVLEAKGGKVKLLKPVDYDPSWDPREDNRTPVWEALHQLIRALNQGGESAAGALLARMPERSADIRRLAFWLYTLCERKGWAEDARDYNELVTAWYGIESASRETGEIHVQGSLDV